MQIDRGPDNTIYNTITIGAHFVGLGPDNSASQSA